MDAKATILSTLGDAEPPTGLPQPLKALWWLRKGDFRTGAEWRRAHDICQSSQGEADFDMVHALAHLIEGDAGNAAYWYRRAGTQGAGADIPEEWDLVVGRLDR